LWKLLKRLGYDCGWFANHPLGGFQVRVCKHSSSKSRIILTENPPDEFVDPTTLIGVRLQLDNFGVMSREEFDRWKARRAKANSAKETNGEKPARKPRTPHQSA
jgi:hypothetical protein